MLTTDGTLLGGRVRYRQPANGFRSGIEPVLLAASVPAEPGEHVLEAGSGAGAALLCLAFRVTGVRACGVEIDAGLATLATANAAANGFAGIRVWQGALEDVAGLRTALKPAFDHAIANPPYHPAGTPSPLAARETAKRGSALLVSEWINRLAALLRHHGSLTLILPAWLVPAALEGMDRADCRCAALFPLWPKAGREAKLVLLRGIRQGRSPLRVMAGLVLHREQGGFTDAARAVLEDGGATALSGSAHAYSRDGGRPPGGRPSGDQGGWPWP
jgi:tRNA1Val (adenine37-N6)-methyltransferase